MGKALEAFGRLSTSNNYYYTVEDFEKDYKLVEGFIKGFELTETILKRYHIKDTNELIKALKYYSKNIKKEP